jgi:hypothetical protein
VTTWPGWESDLLGAASLPDTAENRAFLGEWRKHAEAPDCDLNPIDLTHTYHGDRTGANVHSHNCKQTGTFGLAYQRYDDRVWARSAFAAQISSGDYPHLQAALASGNPYTATDYQGVNADLGKWQSFDFGFTYLNETSPVGSSNVKAAHAHGGWRDLQRTVNHKMPAALHDSRRAVRAGMRSLHRAGKVRL